MSGKVETDKTTCILCYWEAFSDFLSHKPVRTTDRRRKNEEKKKRSMVCVRSCELKLHLHAEQLHPLQMSGGLARPRAGTSITVSWSWTAQTLVENCQGEKLGTRGELDSSPAATLHRKCWKRPRDGLCVQCLNISHLQSNLMNYSDGAIYWASHLKHLPCQPVCQLCLTLSSATGSF